MSRSATSVVLASFLAFGSISGVAHADEVTSTSTSLDITSATALSSSGSTRWSRIGVVGPTKVLWLVPVRPGGTVAWANDRWLDALEETSAPRILPPEQGCTAGIWVTTASKAERLGSWSRTGAKLAPATFTLTTSSADLAPFAPSAAASAHAAALYAQGWSLAAVELDAGAASVTSATLRVTDSETSAVLPLTVASGGTDARVTSFVIADGPVAAGQELAPASLVWDALGSDYVDRRAQLLGGPGTWLRETASHAGIFEPLVVPGESSLAPLVDRAPGDDLALALAGSDAARVAITRFAGRLPTVVTTTPLTTNAPERSQVATAGAVASCAAPVAAPAVPIVATGGGSRGGSRVVYGDEGSSVEGCGSAAIDIAAAAAASDDESSTDDSGDDGSSADDGSSNDDGDDATDDGSDDAADDGSDDSADDGSDDSADVPIEWGTDDDENGMSPQTVHPKAKGKKTSMHKAKTSPVSRLALLVVGVVLPFRRRLRRVTL